jgi:hypothetical protein
LKYNGVMKSWVWIQFHVPCFQIDQMNNMCCTNSCCRLTLTVLTRSNKPWARLYDLYKRLFCPRQNWSNQINIEIQWRYENLGVDPVSSTLLPNRFDEWCGYSINSCCM